MLWFEKSLATQCLLKSMPSSMVVLLHPRRAAGPQLITVMCDDNATNASSQLLATCHLEGLCGETTSLQHSPTLALLLTHWQIVHSSSTKPREGMLSVRCLFVLVTSHHLLQGLQESPPQLQTHPATCEVVMLWIPFRSQERTALKGPKNEVA